MWPSSGAFSDAIAAGSTTRVTRLDLLTDGVVTVAGVPTLGGIINVDVTASVSRRRGQFSLIDPDGSLTPSGALDPLSPYGYELRAWSGIRTSAGDELVPVATLRVSSVSVSNDGGGARRIEVVGFDRARAISRARFDAPYAVAAGVNYITAITALVSNRLPGVSFDVQMTTTLVTPVLLFDQASDPLAALTSMCQAIGAEGFFNPLGVFVIRPEPTGTGDPVAFYEEGDTARILALNNELTDEPGYNGAVVDGEPAASGVVPVHAVVYDTDQASPTYSLGRYNKVPTFLRSQFITTDAQALGAAQAEYRRNRGGTESLSFTALPDPRHEGLDVVRVTSDPVRVGGDYLIESLALPFDGVSAMTVNTRKRRSL